MMNNLDFEKNVGVNVIICSAEINSNLSFEVENEARDTLETLGAQEIQRTAK